MKESKFKKILDFYNENNFPEDKVTKTYLPFNDVDGNRYFVIDSHRLSNIEIKIALDIADFMFLVSEYRRKGATLKVRPVKEHKLENIISQISLIGKNLGFNFKKQIVREIFNQSRPAKTEQEKTILSIGNAFYSITDDKSDLVDINQKITGFVGFRTFNATKNGQAITDYKIIPQRYNDVLSFSKEGRFTPLLSAATAMYFTRTDHFFRGNNELASILFAEKLLSRNVPTLAIEMMPIIEVVTRYSSYFKKNIDLTRSTKDMTYTYVLFMAIIHESVIEAYNNLLESYNQIKLEGKKFDSKEKNYYIKKLIAENPTISKRQANFFISHRDKELFYTIEDFKEFTGSSYETSRYSLENLVKIGLYSKIKVGKKYVYKAH